MTTRCTLLRALDTWRRRQHDRPLYERQRAAHEHLAGGADDLVRSERTPTGKRFASLLIRWPGCDLPDDHNEIMTTTTGSPHFALSRGRHCREAEGGYTANGLEYKVHLDVTTSPISLKTARDRREQQRRQECPKHFLYPTTTACWWPAQGTTSMFLRAAHGRYDGFVRPFTTLRLQKIFNLFQDPFERATSPPTPSGTEINHTQRLWHDGLVFSSWRHSRIFHQLVPPSFNRPTYGVDA